MARVCPEHVAYDVGIAATVYAPPTAPIWYVMALGLQAWQGVSIIESCGAWLESETNGANTFYGYSGAGGGGGGGGSWLRWVLVAVLAIVCLVSLVFGVWTAAVFSGPWQQSRRSQGDSGSPHVELGRTKEEAPHTIYAMSSCSWPFAVFPCNIRSLF
jgi:hypothetical protein